MKVVGMLLGLILFVVATAASAQAGVLFFTDLGISGSTREEACANTFASLNANNGAGLVSHSIVIADKQTPLCRLVNSGGGADDHAINMSCQPPNESGGGGFILESECFLPRDKGTCTVATPWRFSAGTSLVWYQLHNASFWSSPEEGSKYFCHGVQDAYESNSASDASTVVSSCLIVTTRSDVNSGRTRLIGASQNRGNFSQCVPFNLGKNSGQPTTCAGTNPINVAVGLKHQTESDYRSSAGPFPLILTRYYNSAAGSGGGHLGLNWRHFYDRRIYKGPLQILVSRHDGREFIFSGAVDLLSDPDVTDKLVALRDTSGNTTGWQLTTADGDIVETYGLDGKLLSLRNRAGLVQTLAYSTDATAKSIATMPGMLISVTDPFGRSLQFSYFENRQLKEVVLPDGQSVRYSYDSLGRLTTVTYPDQRTRIYQYENASFSTLLTGITDENGDRFATWSYDTQGRAILSEHAGGADRVSVLYNPDGTSSVTDALNATRIFSFADNYGSLKSSSISGPPSLSCGMPATSYDFNGFVASQRDWNGNQTTYQHNDRGLEVSRTEGLTSSGAVTPDTRTVTTEWHETFRLPTRIAEPLRITQSVYDADGAQCGARGALCSKSVQATTDIDGSQGFSAAPAGSPRTWTYTYNTNGSVLTINGPRIDVADIRSYTYYANDDPEINKRGNLASVTNALGHRTDITAYNAHGKPLTIIDANTLTTTLTYDERQRLKTRTVGSEITSYDYDGVGQLTKLTLPDGSFLSYSHDAAHRMTGIQDNAANRIAYSLDAMGNRTLEQVFDPANTLVQTRSRVYSNLNRLFQELGALNQTTEYGYDNQGNLTSVKDPLNHITSSQYDALNRVKQITDPALGLTKFAYNGLDALTQVTDPRNLVTGYTVDGLGNLTLQVSPDTGNTANTYDPAGNLLTRTDGKGQVTTYAYDALNRVTLITFHDSSKEVYAYDQVANGIGRLSSITEINSANQQTSLIQYAYTPQGRVASETRTVNGTTYLLGYSYDSSGRLAGLTYPSGRTLTYAFDSLGRIAAVSTTFNGQTQQVVSNVTYHPFGAVKSYNLGNGQAYTRSYDQDGRISTYTLGANSFGVGYDAASRIEFISELGNPSNINSYGYDSLDRLTSAVIPGTSYGYTYDQVGNRLSKTAGAATETLTYNTASNRVATLTPASGPPRSFVFDSNGSTTNDGINTYAYDVRGRMVQATSSIGATSYQLNALGQRIRKSNSQTDTVFHYDTVGRLIAETTPAGNLKREIFYLNDIPVGMVQ